MSEEEAFEHAIEMIQTRQMGFRKAADFFSVSIVSDLQLKYMIYICIKFPMSWSGISTILYTIYYIF